MAPDNKICVTGSVDGVKTAPIIVATKITYFHCFNILCPDTIPSIPNII